MALRFLESFDHYTAGWGSVGEKWSDGGNAFGNSSFSAGRTGLMWQNNDSDRRIFRDFTDENVWIVGFAVSKTGPFGIFCGWWDTTANDWQCTIGLDSANRMVLYRGFAGTLLATGTNALPNNTFNYVEWKVEIDNAGDSEVMVNGVSEISVTGVDLQNTANAFARRFFIGGFNGGLGRRDYDDIYILDSVDSGVTGAPNNDFLGDMRIECIFPNGNGNSSQLDGSDGNSTDNYLLVDEVTPDGDTTYVESGDAGDRDTYAYGNLSTVVGTVYGVQPIPSARKTDAGARTFCSVARLGTSEEDSADHNLTSAYLYYPDCRDGDPDGDQWTISSINSAEFGVKVTS